MSAKGRGADVVESEFYPTPAWCTRRALEALGLDSGLEWLEPCAGDGAIVNIVNEFYCSSDIVAGDVRLIERGTASQHYPYTDFHQFTRSFDAVITNPPFSLAPELIRHFLPRCDWLILLLRASFRLSEWRHNMPDEYKLPQRPEFVASLSCKKRDAAGKSVAGCGWSHKQPIADERPKACPLCGSPSGRWVQCSTTDASEYSWFVWTPERNRGAGTTRVLPDTPLEERRER